MIVPLSGVTTPRMRWNPFYNVVPIAVGGTPSRGDRLVCTLKTIAALMTVCRIDGAGFA